jgi:hypothetical protein
MSRNLLLSAVALRGSTGCIAVKGAGALSAGGSATAGGGAALTGGAGGASHGRAVALAGAAGDGRDGTHIVTPMNAISTTAMPPATNLETENGSCSNPLFMTL